MATNEELAERYGQGVVEKSNLIKYLEYEYGVAEQEAIRLIEKHKDIVDKGSRLLSFTYYVGDQIMCQEEKG